MSIARTCRECDAPIPRDAPFGHCPGCLVELGFGSPSESLRSVPNAFGDYQLLETIGRGGMGVVYKARQISLNRLVALKMLTPQSAAFPRVAERLRIEAEAAAGLHHPGIVTIHEVGEQDGQPFFTMELVEGAGLDKFIDRFGYRHPRPGSSDRDKAREPQASIVHTMIAIARAVDYAHKRGVLHRDLKPANVVIDASGEPHLTDFGLAKILGRERNRETDSGSVLGTPAYMAPEQAAGETKRVSTAADIYSLGAVFYEMLTGRPPFRGDTPLETLRLVTEEEPKPPDLLNEKVDVDLATICLKCLDKNPERRYDTAQALADDLDRWRRREPIEARPVGQLERIWRWCRREPRLVGMAAGLVGLLAASTVLALTLYERERDRAAVERQNRDRERRALLNRIDKEWSHEDRPGVKIYASEFGVLSERPFTIEGNERTVVLGAHPQPQVNNPLQILQRLTPLVNCLQTNLAFPAEVPLLFELQIYKSYSNAIAGLSKGEIDLMLLSPLSYVRLRPKEEGIVPLARLSTSRGMDVRTAIFCRTESTIRQLRELNGKSLAFGSMDIFLVEDCVKAELQTAGLRVVDLARVDVLPRGAVASAVNEGRYDVGVMPAIELARLTNVGVRFRILHEIPTPGYLCVGTKRLEPALAGIVQERLLGVNDANVLEAVNDELTGFKPARASDFDGMEQTIEKARLFDGEIP